jgi:hypothetical protein
MLVLFYESKEITNHIKPLSLFHYSGLFIRILSRPVYALKFMLGLHCVLGITTIYSRASF